jgi:hypothetical protein
MRPLNATSIVRYTPLVFTRPVRCYQRDPNAIYSGKPALRDVGTNFFSKNSLNATGLDGWGA